MRPLSSRPPARPARRRLLRAALAAAMPASLALAAPAAAQSPATDQPRNGGDAPRAAAPSPLQAALDREGYGTPPAEIARLVTAPRHLNVTLGHPSPDRSRFPTLRSDRLTPVRALAHPCSNRGA